MRVAIAGATGAVGTVMRELVVERGFPCDELVLLASARSAGRTVDVGGERHLVREMTGAAFAGVDLALFSAGAERSRAYAPTAVAAGAVVVDNSSAYRMDPDVPLVVSEVNPDALERHRGIVANPNCTTMQLMVAVAPLHRAAGLRRIVLTSFQAVSGSGQKGVDELERTAAGGPAALYAHPIAANVLPHCDDFVDEGYTREEWKVVNESRKILDLPELAVTATCVRVPVVTGHSEAALLEFARPVDAAEARAILADAPGVELVDDPSSAAYPLATHAAGRDPVYVGRIRSDLSNPHGLWLWVVADNLRKGAALNAVQIAEELVARGLLGARAGAAAAR
jgi:aspartate-semialdehyde dehydrogenase